VYETFFRTVREINATLPAEERYRVLAGDIAVDWDTIRELDDLMPYFGTFRSEHLFQVVRREVLGKNRKALLIAGGAHTSRRSMVRRRNSGLPWAEVSTGALLDLYYPGALFVIGALKKEEGFDYARLASIPHGTLIPVAGTWLGSLEANMITNMRNYDGTPFTLYGEAQIEDMVDALLYWGPPDDYIYTPPPAHIYQDDAYWNTLNQRSLMLRGQPMDSTLRQ
jgi:hypothetical protein